MSTIISMEIAHLIWSAHREIEVGKKLLADLVKAIEEGRDPTPIDTFSRALGFQLGVPQGESSHRLFNVNPKLAVRIIEAHIADKEHELRQASIAAQVEMTAANK